MRRILGLLLAVATAAGGAQPALARAQTTQPKHWIIVDADSGAVLAAGNAHEPALAAGAVKLMTALTALERLTVDSTLTVGAAAAGAPPERVGMIEGEEWSVDAAVKAMLLIGANDATYALAEGAGGSLAGFAEAMAATGERIGLADSEFHDPAGLDDADAFEGGTRMSAYDLAVVARNTLAIPELAETLALREYELTTPAGTSLSLTNTLTLLDAYDGANGQKQGYTNQAGSVIVASATRADRTIIAVALGVAEPTTWAAAALDDGFATSPESAGTGEALPAVAVASATANAAALTGLAPALGRPAVGVAAAGSGAGGEAPATSVTDRPAPEDRGGLPLAVSVLILVVLVVGGAVLARRMLVSFLERRQLEESSAFPDAHRRGWLQVVERGDLHEPGPHVRPVRRSRPR